MTKGYDVWFPTVREAYDRSAIVQQIIVEETENEVRITNPTSQPLDGFTLFTKTIPGYSLADQSHIITAQKGAVDSWAFVIDLLPGETLVFEKQINDCDTGAFDKMHIPDGLSVSGLFLGLRVEDMIICLA
jgi:hypothetical protein